MHDAQGRRPRTRPAGRKAAEAAPAQIQGPALAPRRSAPTHARRGPPQPTLSQGDQPCPQEKKNPPLAPHQPHAAATPALRRSPVEARQLPERDCDKPRDHDHDFRPRKPERLSRVVERTWYFECDEDRDRGGEGGEPCGKGGRAGAGGRPARPGATPVGWIRAAA